MISFLISIAVLLAGFTLGAHWARIRYVTLQLQNMALARFNAKSA